MNLYRNADITLYGWMQTHYPAMREWAFGLKETHNKDYLHYSEHEDLDSFAYETLLKMGPALPPPDQIGTLSEAELAFALDLIYTHFEDYAYPLQEAHSLDPEGLHDWVYGQDLASGFRAVFVPFIASLSSVSVSDRVGSLIARSYTADDAAPFSSQMGYWTPGECQAFRPLLQALVDPDAPDYRQLESQMQTFFKQSGDPLPAAIRQTRRISNGLLQQLQMLPTHQGLIGRLPCDLA